MTCCEFESQKVFFQNDPSPTLLVRKAKIGKAVVHEMCQKGNKVERKATHP